MRQAGFVSFFLVLLLSPVVQGQESAPFTLEQIMSAPFPAGMQASPDGKRVAWVFNEQGARNVWVAEAPDWQGRRLTEWTQDDGTTLSSLSWTPDSSKVIFVRGDGPNRFGELPNPTHNPAGVEQAVWMADLESGSVERLAEGSSPLVSPRGDGLIFRAGGGLQWLDLQTPPEGEEREPKPLLKARGGLSWLSFSPDGAHLALVSRRGPTGYVGIYSLEEKSLRFPDASVDGDFSPVFSPDGRQVAFIRIPVTGEHFAFKPRRSGHPWSIRVVDLESGQARQVWRAEEGRGSVFRNIVASSQLFWSKDGYLVFPWEKDGWTHLWAVPARGGSARLLTPGQFEVEQVELGRDGSSLIYSSNQGDIDRRHLWRVDAAGGAPRQLTSGASNEWAPTPLAEGRLALIQSTGKHPAHPALLEEGQVRPLAADSLPDDFPLQHLVEPRQVVFSGADGLPIHGQLFLPPQREDGEKHPAMLYFHGGSRRQMLLGWHYSNYYHNCYAFNQYLASQGYVVMSVNYRSGIGYGMEFREAENYGATGASEFNDVLGAGLYLRGREDVDGQRIGLWGGSYGGYLTALGLARASHLFAAGVDVHGVHDWNVVIQNFIREYEPLEYPEAARLAFESSPMASIESWRSPVLLIHGDDDRNVPFSESVDLVESLRKQGVEFEQLVFPDEVHGFLRYESWLTAFRRSAQFLDKHLKNAEMSP
ncbi:MAG TPA: prolyl oligopeptidase family serine peptidase, partial [Acidobacteriota bacterium]|nr:prolyl oligopeptidase family serine peptidase [Acidobacteriota bacterium]